jgi:hypothetical protein
MAETQAMMVIWLMGTSARSWGEACRRHPQGLGLTPARIEVWA